MSTAPTTSTSPSAASTATTVTIGSRKSRLAVIQTEIVRKALREAWPDLTFEVQTMSTAGDKDKTTALHDMNAKSLWTQELEVLLLDGRLDLIVHSLKDIPTQLPPTLTIGAIFPREDPRDALVVKPSLPHTSLADLPAGSVVGTSSVRRTAQIARKYPLLKFENVRGNVETRLAKLDAEDGRYACIILAAAGLKRLDLAGRITNCLDSTTERSGVPPATSGEGRNKPPDAEEGGWLHAVGQGALGIEIREGDDRIHDLLKRLACPETTLSCLAERSLMRTLEGGCSVPIGVETDFVDDAGRPSPKGESRRLRMRASVTSTDGLSYVAAHQIVQVRTEADADAFGRAVAKELVDKGAGEILQEITLNRDVINA